MIDIHTHISEYEETEIIQIIKRAQSAGVKNIISAKTILIFFNVYLPQLLTKTKKL